MSTEPMAHLALHNSELRRIEARASERTEDVTATRRQRRATPRRSRRVLAGLERAISHRVPRRRSA